MSKRLATSIAAFLKVNEGYRSWERLPDEFLRRNRQLPGERVVQAALDLWKRQDHRYRWAAVTLLRSHPTAFRCVRWRPLEEMGGQMGNWGDVDTFASLAGPAWRSGQISDWRVHRWARSQNRWWRRAALVSTVFLNRRSAGGHGDTGRTLAVAELLANDRDDMVVKGMSWALRELIPVDRRAEELRSHVHVHHVEGEAKFWLEPDIELAQNYGLTARRLSAALELIRRHEHEIRTAWKKHFRS